MVKVKRAGVWVTVPKGRDVSTFRKGGAPSRRAPQVELAPSQNLAIKEGRNPNLTPSQRLAVKQGRVKNLTPKRLAQIEKVTPETIRAAQKKKTAQEIAVDKAKSRLLNITAQQEFKKILNKRSNIIKRGGREKSITSKDAKSGNILNITTWKKNGDLVRRVKDETKGTVKYTAFSVPRGGGSPRLTRGVTVPTVPTVSISQQRKKQEQLNKFVNFAAELIPFKFTRGTGKITRAIDVGNNKMQDFVFTYKNGTITEAKALGTPIQQSSSFKESGRVFREGVVRKQEEQRPESFLRNLSRKWQSDISSTKTRLRSAVKRGDLNRLKQLDGLILSGKATARDRRERANLERTTAKNYELAAELITKTIGSTLINIGVGSKDLLEALKEDPKATLAALPSAVYEGVKQDFNRVMSGDPLEITTVGLEYWTIGKVFRLPTKGVKVPISIGVKLSPKYLGGIGKGLVVPPAIIRGAVRRTKTFKKASRAVKKQLAKPKVRKAVSSFNKKIKSSQSQVSKKLEIIKIKSRKVKRKVKKIKEKRRVKKAIKEARKKSDKEYNNQLKSARRSRALARKKGRTISIGNNDYIEAVALIESLADKTAEMFAKRYLRNFKKKGGKIGLGQEQEFIKRVKIFAKKNIEKMPEFKKLKAAGRINKPFQIKLIKAKKLQTAKKLLNRVKKKITGLLVVKKISSIIRKIKVVKRKVSPKKIKKKIKRRIQVAKGRAQFKKTIRYKMEKSRPLRKVTLTQLNRASSVSQMNKAIDQMFLEIAKKQTAGITPLQLRQFKNVVKKRVGRAIKSGNKEEVRKFLVGAKKMLQDINKKSSNPDIRISRKVKGKKSFKTIRDFSPDTPKGKYVEIKRGNQVQLVEQKQVVKQKTKQIQRQQVTYIVESISKKKISLNPLLKYGIYSLSVSVLKNVLKLKQAIAQKSKQGQLAVAAQLAGQDIKIVQAVAQKVSPKLNVAQAVLQKSRTSQRLKTRKIKRVQKKKPAIRPKRRKHPSKKKPSKKKNLGYTSSLVKNRRQKTINKIPISKMRAFDIISFLLVKNKLPKGVVSKSQKQVSEETLKRKVAKVPTGYFKKNRSKFSVRKLKTRAEKYEIIVKKIKSKAVKKRVARKKPAKRKPARRKKRK